MAHKHALMLVAYLILDPDKLTVFSMSAWLCQYGARSAFSFATSRFVSTMLDQCVEAKWRLFISVWHLPGATGVEDHDRQGVWRVCVYLCESTMSSRLPFLSPRASRIRTQVCPKWESQFALPFGVRVVIHSCCGSRIDQINLFNHWDTSQDLENAHILGFTLPWYSCKSCKHYHQEEGRLAGRATPHPVRMLAHRSCTKTSTYQEGRALATNWPQIPESLCGTTKAHSIGVHHRWPIHRIIKN